MDDLIKALTILRMYGNPSKPTHCEHDVLFVDVNPNLVSVRDKLKLSELGFISGNIEDKDDEDEDDWDDEYEGGFYSFRFGSS